VPVALPIVGGFALGLAARGLFQHRFDVLFRANQACGLGLLALLAGWCFKGGSGSVGALGVLLAAQLVAVLLAARLFRGRADGPLLAFALYGNPSFWAVPVAAALLGPRAAVIMVAYDMLTQPRLAVAIRLMRARAPVEQPRRTLLTEYAPVGAAVCGLLLGQVVAAPAGMPDVVAALGVTMAAAGALLLGLAWPRRPWAGRRELRDALPVLALHLSLVPGVMLGAALAGLAVPAGAWFLAFGPLPLSLLSFARLYGYSTRLAASALALSLGTAVALLPVAFWLAGHA
jgi:predicted permease